MWKTLALLNVPISGLDLHRRILRSADSRCRAGETSEPFIDVWIPPEAFPKLKLAEHLCLQVSTYCKNNYVINQQ